MTFLSKTRFPQIATLRNSISVQLWTNSEKHSERTERNWQIQKWTWPCLLKRTVQRSLQWLDKCLAVVNISKGYAQHIFATLFLGLKDSTFEIRKNVFYFTLKAPFLTEVFKFWNVEISNFMTSWYRTYILLNNSRSRYSLAKKLASWCNITKGKFLKKLYINYDLETSSRPFCVYKGLSHLYWKNIFNVILLDT